MGAIIEARRMYASERLDKLVAALTTAETIIGDKACVYITGSGARGELTQHSDFDLFIVSDVEVRREKRPPTPLACQAPAQSHCTGAGTWANILADVSCRLPRSG